jgi:hypothetical protein
MWGYCQRRGWAVPISGHFGLFGWSLFLTPLAFGLLLSVASERLFVGLAPVRLGLLPLLQNHYPLSRVGLVSLRHRAARITR